MAVETHYQAPFTQRAPASRATSADGRSSVAGLLKELRDEGTTLFRQEVQLAKQEMTEKAARMGKHAGTLVAGGVVAYAGLMLVLLALSALLYAGLVEAGLSHMVSGWLAPLIVGLVVASIGIAVLMNARRKLSQESATPEWTMRSLEENTQWAKEKVSQ